MRKHETTTSIVRAGHVKRWKASKQHKNSVPNTTSLIITLASKRLTKPSAIESQQTTEALRSYVLEKSGTSEWT